MPSGFASLDTGFPNVEGKTTDQKVDALQDYVYQLLEQLRYLLHNIGPENFNSTEVIGWLGQTIEEPIKIAIKDLEDQIETEIEIAADGLMVQVRKEYAPEWTVNTLYHVNDVVRITTTVGDEETLAFYRCLEDHTSAAGNKPPSAKWASVTDTTVLYSRFNMTAEDIRTEVGRASGVEGTLSTSISTVDQKADEIRTEVSQVTEITANPWTGSHAYSVGDYVTVTTGSSPNQTTAYYRCNTAHTSSNSNKPGTEGGADYWTPIPAQNGMAKQMSSISQKADGIYAQVTDGNDNYTVLNLKSDGLHVGSASGTTTINGSSIKVRSDADTTLDALTANENNVTVIDGGKIKTNSVTATQINATNLQVAAANVTGTLTASQIDASQLHVSAANIDGTITADSVNSNWVYAGAIKANQIQSGTAQVGYLTADYLTSTCMQAIAIDASQITTGTIIADECSASDITAGYLNANAVDLAGEFNVYRKYGSTYYQVGSLGAVDGYDGSGTTWGVALASPYGSQYIIVTSSGARMTAGSYDVYVTSNMAHMGSSSKYLEAYSTGCFYGSAEIAVVSSSDRRVKTDIDYDMTPYEDFFLALRPCTFRRTDIDDHSVRIGFIAQDIQASLEENHLKDIGMVFEQKQKPPTTGAKTPIYGLHYDDFAGLSVHMIQKLMGRCDALEARIAQLEGR
jgi:hypothetical protein